MKKKSDFSAFENAPDKKPGYTPPYKFRRPQAPDNPYDIICPYWKSERKNIQWDFEPIRFAPPRLKLQRQLRAPPEES